MVLYDINNHYKIPRELGRQKKKWSQITHVSHVNIVNFHARGLHTPRATYSTKLTLGCALLLIAVIGSSNI